MSTQWLSQTPDNVGHYLSGFADGEGSFNASLRQKDDYANKWQISLSFNVSQRDRTVLALYKRYLGCGTIKTRRDGLCMYEVVNYRMICERVIPFFRKYKFLSASKKNNFRIFAQMADMMLKGLHQNEGGMRELLMMREKLNIGHGRTRKYSIHDVFKEESSETIRQNHPADDKI